MMGSQCLSIKLMVAYRRMCKQSLSVCKAAAAAAAAINECEGLASSSKGNYT